MAITQTGSHATETAPSAPQAAAAPAPDFSTVETAPGRLGFKSVLAQFSSGAGVTPEIEKYLKSVFEMVSKSIKNVTMVQLPEPTATHAFITTTTGGDKYAFVIIFTDAIGSILGPNLPKSLFIPPAFEALGHSSRRSTC